MWPRTCGRAAGCRPPRSVELTPGGTRPSRGGTWLPVDGVSRLTGRARSEVRLRWLAGAYSARADPPRRRSRRVRRREAVVAQSLSGAGAWNDGGVPTVFINYRAQEQAGYAALLDRELAERFGPGAVFRASRSIRPGDDFVRAILENLRLCRVLLAVIGPEWLASGRRGHDQQGDEPDWVHREIAEALTLGIRVIPILVEDARMPSEADLPADIAALARCQYLRLHHRNIDNDIGRVVDELGRLVPELRTDRRRPREVAETEVRLFRLVGELGPACRIGVITGSIRRVRCADIWVNSENTDMEMSRFTDFSVSGIIRYWGARRDQAGRVTGDLIGDALRAAVGERRPVAPGA